MKVFSLSGRTCTNPASALLLKFAIVNLMLALLLHVQIFAQIPTTLSKSEKNARLTNAIRVPIFLMGSALIATTDVNIIGKKEVYEERNEHYAHFHSNADDYIQYAPIVGVLSLNAFGVKGQNNFGTQMKLLAKAELLMIAMTIPLKKFTSVQRPDGSTFNSFPSGHTAEAFLAATFMHKEYGKEHPLYSVLAYASASSVGVLRVLNNRHWSSDVLFGAGIGILSANLVYLLHDEKKIKETRIVAMPSYQQGAIGINAIISLN